MKKRRKEIIKKGKELQEDYRDIRKIVHLKEAMIGNNKEDNFTQKLERMEATTRYLVELGNEASTMLLKNACEITLIFFNLENKIREEFEMAKSSLESARGKMKEMNKEIRKLKMELKQINYFRGDGKYEFDDDKWTKFLLLNEETPLFKI